MYVSICINCDFCMDSNKNDRFSVNKIVFKYVCMFIHMYVWYRQGNEVQ